MEREYCYGILVLGTPIQVGIGGAEVELLILMIIG